MGDLFKPTRTTVAIVGLVLVSLTFQLFYSYSDHSPKFLKSPFIGKQLKLFNSQQGFVPHADDHGRYESTDIWRSPDSFFPAHMPAHRPQVPNAATFSTVGEYVRQSIPADYAEGSDKIFLMIKTGGSVLWKRLPIHLFTTLTRVPNFALYSDAPGSIGGYEVIDVLANLTQETHDSDAFTLYRQQKYIHDAHLNVEYTDVRNPGGAAWDLDKFKNLPMLSHAAKVSPDSDWYVFMDADTYFFMDSLIEVLKGYDPNERWYIGSPAGAGDYTFAHGGSGVVLSKKALHDSLGKHPEWVNEFVDQTANSCCGDLMVAVMLKDRLDCRITPYRGFRGDAQWDIEIAEPAWCLPAVSFHHITPHDIEILWEYEKVKRLSGEPILTADIYRDFVHPYIENEIPHWNNRAEGLSSSYKQDKDNGIVPSYEGGTDVRPYETPAACRAFCEAHEGCLMYRQRKDECKIAWFVKLGRSTYEWQNSANKEDTFETTSGWMIDRIREVREKSSCDSVVNVVHDKDRSEGWYRRQMASSHPIEAL